MRCRRSRTRTPGDCHALANATTVTGRHRAGRVRRSRPMTVAGRPRRRSPACLIPAPRGVRASASGFPTSVSATNSPSRRPTTPRSPMWPNSCARSGRGNVRRGCRPRARDTAVQADGRARERNGPTSLTTCTMPRPTSPRRPGIPWSSCCWRRSPMSTLARAATSARPGAGRGTDATGWPRRAGGTPCTHWRASARARAGPGRAVMEGRSSPCGSRGWEIDTTAAATCG